MLEFGGVVEGNSKNRGRAVGGVGSAEVPEEVVEKGATSDQVNARFDEHQKWVSGLKINIARLLLPLRYTLTSIHFFLPLRPDPDFPSQYILSDKVGLLPALSLAAFAIFSFIIFTLSNFLNDLFDCPLKFPDIL